MTPSSLLAELCDRGVVLRLSEDRLRILAPKDVLTPELRQALVKAKPELRRLLLLADEFRSLVREAFAIIAEGPESEGALGALAEDQSRLTDELGVQLATAIRNMEIAQWVQDLGLCPVCGPDRDCSLCARRQERPPTGR